MFPDMYACHALSTGQDSELAHIAWRVIWVRQGEEEAKVSILSRYSWSPGKKEEAPLGWAVMLTQAHSLYLSLFHTCSGSPLPLPALR